MNRRNATSVIIANVLAASVFATRASAAIAPRDDLRERLYAILNRPLEGAGGWDTCNCASCGGVQSCGFDCAVCGFSGTPKTIACRCMKVRKDRIESFNWMKAALARGAMPSQLGLTVEVLDGDIREALKMPTTECWHGTGDCCHTTPFCPVCGDVGDGSQAKNNWRAAWETIRDLRSTLAGGAL